MLAFGTSYDYYNAVWVKNEWSRFLRLMTKDKGKYPSSSFSGGNRKQTLETMPFMVAAA